MPSRCVVAGCSGTRVANVRAVHQIPLVNGEPSRDWEKFVKVWRQGWKASDTSMICSDHFRPEDYFNWHQFKHDCLTYTDITYGCWPHDGYCITLFEVDVGITWAQAQDHCEETGGMLLEIRSPSVQQHVEPLVADLGEMITAWIGGTRLTSDRLRNLDAQHRWDRLTLGGIDENDLNCVVAAIDDGQITYKMDNCDENHGHHTVVCSKYNLLAPYSDGRCVQEIVLNDACYIVMYNGTHNNRESSDVSPDWFSAQNLCRFVLQDFELFDNVEDEIMTSVLNHVGDSIWMGVYRKPWIWNNTDIIGYFNWAPNYGDSSGKECMTIGNDGKWRHTECHELRKYHTCLENIPPADTSTTIGSPLSSTVNPTSQFSIKEPLVTDERMSRTWGTSTMTPTLTFPLSSTVEDIADTLSTSEPSESEVDGSSSGNGLPEKLPVYAGAAAGGVVLLVIIVIVVVCVVRKRNRKGTPELQEEVYSEQGAGGDTSHMAGDVTREGGDAAQEAPRVSDVCATVNKPKPEEADMEDVVVDNALYGEM